MESSYDSIFAFLAELKQFFSELLQFLTHTFRLHFIKFENGKGVFVTAMYRQRGKLARKFVHSGMAGLAAFGVMIAPAVAQEFPGRNIDPWDVQSPSAVLSATTDDPATSTSISEKPRDKIIEYTVQEGDTLSTIAEKFGVTEETIKWQNDLEKDKIRVGDTLEVLPVSGISHKVSKGDTVYSLAKKYDTSPQAMVDFPYNTFVNDETFELAIGQVIIVPGGAKPQPAGKSAPASRYQQLVTPDAGAVAATGSFIWPTNGRITQYFSWYHKGIDIANKAAPNVVAADSGTVVVAGWPDGYGYGNRVMIDHGNGTRTLYAHLSAIYVNVGQSVARGAAIGRMGTTGRSTGVHLHLEIIRNGVYINPLSVLQ